MKTLIITYDLGGPETSASYKKLEDCIKMNYSNSKKGLATVRFVKTTDSAATVRDMLMPTLDTNDKLFVSTITERASWRCGEEFNSRLKI